MYSILWEFFVKPGKEADFEKHYGKNGTWAQCFPKGKGYLGSHLFRDVSNSLRYITLDLWNSPEDFENFEREYGDEYKSTDKVCEELTTKELRLATWPSEKV